MTLVLDASVALCWFLKDGRPVDRDLAQRALDALKQPGTRALVPATWSLEVANVITRAEAKGLINEAQGEAFVEMLNGLDIDTDSSTASRALSETLQVARRHRLSSYDASYLELAMRAGLPLATLDRDLRKAADKAGVKAFRGPAP